MRPLLSKAAMTWALFVTSSLSAQSPDPADEPPASVNVPYNIVGPTQGGVQFWTDLMIYGDWRIQRNTFTGHCRLLDGRDYRQAWGTFAQCDARFQEMRKEKSLPALQPKVVIVLHGIIRSRDSMRGLCEYLETNLPDHTVLNMSYASTRETLSAHADALASVIDHLEGVSEINFVAHSMGNLVIRHFLADQAKNGKPQDPRIRRIVMLAPPNNGTKLAEKFRDNKLFQFVWGVSGREMAEFEQLTRQLATPDCEFGIIAGAMRERRLINPILDGDGDLVVSVDETRLAGASDFCVLPVMHSTIMKSEKSLEYTKRFLEKGHFISTAARDPIPAGDPIPALDPQK